VRVAGAVRVAGGSVRVSRLTCCDARSVAAAGDMRGAEDGARAAGGAVLRICGAEFRTAGAEFLTDGAEVLTDGALLRT
jgi:hypothetical protein